MDGMINSNKIFPLIFLHYSRIFCILLIVIDIMRTSSPYIIIVCANHQRGDVKTNSRVSKLLPCRLRLKSPFTMVILDGKTPLH